MRKLLAAAAISLLSLNMACQQSDNANRPGNANQNANANANTSGANRGGAVNDTWITAKTKLALIADGRTSGFETDVDSREGVVTLSGKVDTAEAKTAADDVAKKIEGVKSVNNQLQVVPEAKRKDVNAVDDKIEDAIEKALDADASLKDLSLAAESNNGVVTVTGTVDNQDQLVKAAQALRKIPGVKSVVTTPVSVRDEKKS
jgi:hyperosmotically inducible protein